MKKHILRRGLPLLLSIMILFCSIGSVWAASITVLPIGTNQHVYHGEFNGSPQGEPVIVLYTNGSPICYLSFQIAMSKQASRPSRFDSTEGTWLYCIERGATSSTGDKLVQDLELSDIWSNFSPAQQHLIISAMLYGFPNHNEDAYGLAATQLIIWEITEGYRTSANQNISVYSATFTKNKTAGQKIKTAYDEILSRMGRHTQQPSFNGASVTLAGIGEKFAVTLNDTNNILSADGDEWNVETSTGVHCTQSGSSLKIWVDDTFSEGGSHSVTLSRNLETTGNAVYLNLNSQEAIAGIPADPVNMTLNVKLEQKSTLEIIKTSDDGNVANIRFRLAEWVPGIGYCTLNSYTTDSSGKINIPDLKVGTRYQITEETPDGYEAEKQVQEITLKEGTNAVTFVNHHITTSLDIIKTSDDGNVSGIKFQVAEWVPGQGYSSCSSYTTDAEGRINIPDLKVGAKYQITEEVPENYKAEKQVQEITLKEGTNTVTFVNHRITTSLDIIKTSDDGNVSGIKFQVAEWVPGQGYCSCGSYTTDAEGKINILDLKVGAKYRITEEVPDGYESEKQVQEITLKEGTNTVTFVNHRITTSLDIIKTSDDGNVSGIRFNVEEWIPGQGYSSCGSYTTDTWGKINIPDLKVGAKYRITEEVPDGYEAEKQVQEIILEEGTNTVTFVNHPITTSLNIIKTSDDDNVSGIRFNVEEWVPGKGYSSCGSYTTDAWGKINIPDLKIGAKYRITEEVPDGYEAEKQVQEITLREGTNTVTFVNYRSTGSLRIIKISDDGHISGIKFHVDEWVPGQGYRSCGSYITGKSGRINIPDLKCGTKYRITEEVPENYEVEKQVQEITLREGTNTVIFVNHRNTAPLDIIKTSDDGNVSGIRFHVDEWDPSQGYSSCGSYITDAEGKIHVPDLKIDTKYRVTEEIPDGYESENPVQEIVLRKGTNTVEFENTLILGSITVHKTDAAGTPLPGTSFRLEYSTDQQSWKPVIFRDASSAPSVGSCTSQGLEDGILVSEDGGIAAFDGLIPSRESLSVYYRLTEIKAQDGKNLMADVLFEGELPVDHCRDITVHAINTSQFMLPFTGGSGFTATTIGIVLIGLSMIAALILSKRKVRR